MQSILSLLGVIFLIILAIWFFPALLAVGLSIVAVILLLLVFTGVAVLLAPILILFLLIGTIVWIARAIF
ncbi:MAG TPA: hypothetical protein VLH40_10740 [Atribacteraceae bacterium]|nr:hypothetical protein [Atribacteraceae bacterium]